MHISADPVLRVSFQPRGNHLGYRRGPAGIPVIDTPPREMKLLDSRASESPRGVIVAT